jgi:hypothetical protein
MANPLKMTCFDSKQPATLAAGWPALADLAPLDGPQPTMRQERALGRHPEEGR